MELLAPAGSPEALDAALAGGADAIYIGGKMYNARMNAKNFGDEDIRNAVTKCHNSGVKLYVTLNTLIYDKNFKDAVKYAEALYLSGVDALITADIGFSQFLHKYIPDFELHASTQMSGHNSDAAKYLCDMGFKRMVCAREMSKDSIETLVKNSPIEIEMFVHGAMCVCQSGQCLMSSFIGGRSGNRGECAQPCRLPYNNSYPLSLKDMCLAGHITDLAESGVSSLKIEGRRKSPAYVYSVVSTYRKLIDENRNATEKEIAKLASVFSRSGFSDGYYTENIGKGMLGVRSDSDKEATKKIFVRSVDVHKECVKIEETNRNPSTFKEVTIPHDKAFSGKMNTARFYSADNIPETDFFDIIYLPLERFSGSRANGVVMPPVIYDRNIKQIEKQLENARKNGAVHCLVGNIGHISLAQKYGYIIHGDYRLNVYNNSSYDLFKDMADVILSPELTLAQLRDIGGKKSVIVYGRVPLMTLERRTGQAVLRDRRNVSFPIVKEGGREIVLNSVPIYMADKDDAMKKSGIYNRHFIFTTEKQNEVLSVIKAYKDKKSTQKAVKRIK